MNFMLFISKQIFIKHFLAVQIFHDGVIFEINMGNCGSNENQISFWYCESCGEDVDNHGFVEVKHQDFCSINRMIQDLRSKLAISVIERQTEQGCSETAQRRIIDLEAEITRLNSEINSRNSKIAEHVRTELTLLNDTAQRRIKDQEAKITSLKTEINKLNLMLDESRKQNSSNVPTGETIMPSSEGTNTIGINEKSNLKIDEKSDSKITQRSKSKSTDRSRSWQSKRALAIKKGIPKINGCRIQNW